MSYINTVKYFSALKGKHILIHATPGMSLEDIMLSEASQLQERQILYGPTYTRYHNYRNSLLLLVESNHQIEKSELAC